MKNQTDPSRLLRLALRANAAFSIVSGAALLAGARPIAGFIGHGRAADLAAVGGALLGFAAWLLWIAARPEISRGGARLAVALDLGWVLLTAVVLAAGSFNAAGRTVAVVVALLVADFALFQFLGLRRLRKTFPASTV